MCTAGLILCCLLTLPPLFLCIIRQSSAMTSLSSGIGRSWTFWRAGITCITERVPSNTRYADNNHMMHPLFYHSDLGSQYLWSYGYPRIYTDTPAKMRHLSLPIGRGSIIDRLALWMELAFKLFLRWEREGNQATLHKLQWTKVCKIVTEKL